MGLVKVGTKQDIPYGKKKIVEVNNTKIIIFCVDDDEYYAIKDECTHAGVSLSDGKWEGIEVTCPLHSGRFDIRSGEALSPPVSVPVACFKVQLEGDDIFLEFSD